MAELTPLDEKLGEVLGLAQAGDDADELDGFEFLTMAEAGELGHWEIVRQMSEKAGDSAALELAEWAIPIPKRHKDVVRTSSLELAAAEV